MTIRTRLNLWYSAVLCVVALVLVGASLYEELVIERHHHGRGRKGERVITNEDLIDIMTWTLLPAVGLGAAGGWWIARRALQPVTELTTAAEAVHAGNLSQKLPRSGNGDELDRLTEVFNNMTERLDGSFQRIREFTLHASHELKTPLTVLHGAIETELSSDKLAPAEREKLLDQLDEIQRLSKIVDGLTLLTKADAGQISLNFETVALEEIVRDVLEDARILAKSSNITVQLTTCEALSVKGDRHRLRQLLLNLADNAVKYNQPSGAIDFSLRRDGEAAVLKIANTGRNIPPENLPRVFERFFRGDAAHSSTVDGCGLGLSIAQWIVTAHGGKISIVSAPSNPTVVTVQLPALQQERSGV